MYGNETGVIILLLATESDFFEKLGWPLKGPFLGGFFWFFYFFGFFKVFLGHLSHSGDLLLWVGVRRRSSFVVRRASCVVRRALTSSSQELLGQS